MDTLESIKTFDKKYHERCDNLKIEYNCVEQGDLCWWCGCRNPKQALGLCAKHLARLKHGKLLVCSFEDHEAYERHDVADYILEFMQIAESKGLTPEQLLESAVMSVLELGRASEAKNGGKTDG